MSEPSFEAAVRLPAPSLRPSIARYAGYRIDGIAPGTQRPAPSRHVTLIISLGTPIELAASPDGKRRNASLDAFVCGLHDTPATVKHDGHLLGLHLFLTPLEVRNLLGLPAAAIAGQAVDLSDIMGPATHELVDRLHDAETWDERFDIVDELFRRDLKEPRTEQRELAFAWRKLIACDGAIAIDELAREIGWSRRHLGERFTAEFGVTPKTAARILRFEHACRLIKSLRLPLAQVAAECGYHDQSHMTREWQRLAGSPPRAWIAEELPFVQDYELSGSDDW